MERAAVIRFGTSGWRGVLGEEVTFPRLRALVAATAGWLRDGAEAARVVVGYDTRFASARMAEIAAEELARHGLVAVGATGPIPTPVLTHAVHRRRVAGGLMITASHNPPEYHGLKVFGPGGAAIGDGDARRIERAIGKTSQECADPPRPSRPVDLAAAYVRDLTARLDVDRLARSRLAIHYDAMHGAGAGVLDAVLSEAGCRVTLLRGEADPRFGGRAPDPVPAGLGPLVARMASRPARHVGLATDGDADRFGLVLAGGEVLRETHVLALLVDHLARTGRVRRGLAISHATGTLVERVAERHGLPVSRRPMGFKHLAAQLEAGAADVAGDESGGFAWSPMSFDKDGILAGALLAELAASARGGLPGRLAELERDFGRHSCGRRALPATDALDRALARLGRAAPERVGAAPVRAAESGDGVRLRLDDGFVMWRHSGTEPVVRIYAEAAGPRRLERRLDQAERLIVALARESG